MDLTVFYSWQLDRPSSVNKDFLEAALARAIEGVGHQLILDIAMQRDTEGLPGSPFILDAILSRIREAAIFVPDLTIVGRTDERATATCNSNVLIEYGYALKTVGPDCLVPIVNEHFGPVRDLPFDIDRRRVVPYRLAPGASATEKETEEERIATDLSRRLTEILDGGVIFGGLSPNAVKLAKLLVEGSEFANWHDPTIGLNDLLSLLGLAEPEIASAVDELHFHSYADRVSAAGHPLLGVAALPNLFVELDHRFKPWSPPDDALSLAKEVIKADGLILETLSPDLWPIRRLNAAVHYLLKYELVGSSSNVSHPLAKYELLPNEATAIFAAGLVKAPHTRPRRG